MCHFVGSLRLANSDALDFYTRILGQCLHCHRRTSWEGCGKISGVYLVHCCEVSKVGQEYGGLHHIGHSESSFFKHMLEICERLVGESLSCCGGFSSV